MQKIGYLPSQNLRAALTCLCICVFTLPAYAAETAEPSESDSVKERRFRFRYDVTLIKLPPGKTAKVWIPVATSDKHQRVTIRKVELPSGYSKTKDDRFGNSMFFLRASVDQKGRIPLAIEYEVTRFAVTPESGEKVVNADRKQFLLANRLVPVGGKPLELLPRKELIGESRDAVRTIYDRVDQHVRYDKPKGGKWGRGDAAWVCDSRFGNCTDFHSLFISLCRSNKVPARFRIGFPIANKPKGVVGGYHCWAEFADGDHWTSVDISEADKNPDKKDFYFGHLPPDRVIFSTGRDLILEPKQQSGPVNFFVYPHVEVEGKLHKEMATRFSYESIR